MPTPPSFNSSPILAPRTPAEARSRRRVLVASGIVHVLLFALLAALPTRFVRSPSPKKPTEVVFYRPAVAKLEPAAPPPPREEPPVVRATPPPKPKPVRHEPVPAPEPPRVRPEPIPVAAPPRPELRPEPLPEPVAIAHHEPPPVRPEPRVGAFAQPEVVQETRKAPGRQVAPAPALATTTVAPKRRVVARVVEMNGGFETAEATETASAALPPDTGRASVLPTSFDAKRAADPPASPALPASVQRGGFGSGVAAEPAVRQVRRPVETPDTPVEIVSKPRPQYTEEARELRIEGEVAIEVTFIASGEVLVLRVLRGLGHGLDEAAVEAARKIRFTPARREGRPVDHTATLRVVFQLG